MLLQPALSIILVLLGVALGLLLPRPWAEVPEAEAARRTVVTCLMLTNGENRLVLFNPSASAVTYSMTDIVNDQLFVSNASLKGHSFQVSALFSTVFRIEASGPLLVDAGVDYPDSSRQAACFRGTKPAN